MSASIENGSILAGYARAARVVRSQAPGFFFATRFFPPEVARAAHAVYWYCHYTRELGRQAETEEQGHADLDHWTAMVAAGLSGELARHPVLDVFLEAVDQCGIPHEYPLDLIEGARTDLSTPRYANFSQLRGLCHRLGGTVSLMMTHVVGYRDPAPEYMTDMGLALELTLLLRDTGDNLARGRIYFPEEEMAACGYSEADLLAHVRNDAFRALMRFQVERARGYFETAEPGLKLIDPRGRFAVQVAFDLYRQTLHRLEKPGFDVFRRRPLVPAVERCWITARSMAGPITRHLWRVMSA